MRERLAEVVRRLDAAVSRRQAPRVPDAFVPGAEERDRRTALLAEIMAVLRAEHPKDVVGPDEDRLVGLADVFGLDAVDQALVAVAAAPHLDVNIAMVYGLLQGADRPRTASVSLALELVHVPTLSAASFDRLGDSGPLRRFGLIELRPGGTWPAGEVTVPHRILAHLAGSDEVDPAVEPVMAPAVGRTFPQTDVLTRILAAGNPLVWVHAPRGAAGLSLAVGAFRTLEVGELVIDLQRVREPAAVVGVAAAAAREAALRGCGLVIAGAELLGEAAGGGFHSLLGSSRVPIIAIGNRRWDAQWLAWAPATVQAPALAQHERIEIWRSSSGLADRVDALGSLRMTPEAIVQAANLARTIGTGSGQPVTADLLAGAARAVAGVDAARLDSTARFADLVLPGHAEATVRRLVAWARIRDQVLLENPQFGRDPSSRGLAALFSGSPGTGKTLAATVVATELGLDLFQVNLSEIIDKYIGETEKNLERIFHQAESLNVVLFFDEADALFGSRSDVKDAHDRYANQEVAYLLQRIESFDGITILATNLRGNLDAAFVRRLRFMVHFPDPDVPTRRRIWELYLGRVAHRDEHDPVDLDLVAGVLEVAGGDIRNIVLSATFDAAAADEPLGMRHLLAAAEREFTKLGRRLPAGGLGGPG